MKYTHRSLELHKINILHNISMNYNLKYFFSFCPYLLISFDLWLENLYDEISRIIS